MVGKGRFALVVGALAVASVVPIAHAEQQEGEAAAPGFRVEKADIDLGTIVAGDEAVATFVFHNDTDKDVKIIRAKPS
jgi:hypothetical protein